MEKIKPYLDIIAGVSNILTIIASGLAIYIYLKNRDKLSAAVNILLNYSFQTTLGELKEKLERLNEYNANEPSDISEIKNILHEISGQIRGNKVLSASLSKLADKIEALASNKKISEPARRSIVSELREQLKNIQVNNIAIIANNNHE